MALTSALVGSSLAVSAPPATAQTAPGPTPTTVAVTVPEATTTTAPPSTTTTAPAPPPTTTAPPTTGAPNPPPPAPPTTTPGGKKPAVPTGGPPTTTPAPGVPAPPPPDPTPILTQVDTDLAQLNAIDDYKPAQALVATAQAEVTAAGATLQSARGALAAADKHQAGATGNKAEADAKLRTMALAAYIGVGYSTPGFGAPAGGNGDQGPGTVSTPGGLTGVRELDAKEMLILVGQKARSNDDSAKRYLSAAESDVRRAQAAYAKAQAGVSSAEASLLSAQQTLKQVTTAALTPGAAVATPLPNLASLSLAASELTGRSGAGGAEPAGSTSVGTAAATAAADPVPAAPASPAILGPSVLTGPDLAAWFAATGRQANATVPIDQLAQDYQTWGQKTGVRYDLAFAQSVVETGFFSFPTGGQLTAKDNNFAGIGACDTCAHGWSFPDASSGVGAQLELLYEYASPTGLPKGLPDVIGATGPGGCCQTWTQLAGVWASSTVYGISIMTIYNQMLTWLIPRRQAAAGLGATPTPVAGAQGPELAPLPAGGAPTTTTTTAHKP